MNAAGGLHDVRSPKAHRIGQDEVAFENHARTLGAFLSTLFLGLCDLFCDVLRVPNLDPVDSIGSVRDEGVYRTRRTSAFDYTNVHEFLRYPTRLHARSPIHS